MCIQSAVSIQVIHLEILCDNLHPQHLIDDPWFGNFHGDLGVISVKYGTNTENPNPGIFICMQETMSRQKIHDTVVNSLSINVQCEVRTVRRVIDELQQHRDSCNNIAYVVSLRICASRHLVWLRGRRWKTGWKILVADIHAAEVLWYEINAFLYGVSKVNVNFPPLCIR